MTSYRFDAYVTAVLFDRRGACFALGDGSVRFEGGGSVDAHPESGALAAAAHPGGEGIVTGGDDGRLVWSSREGATLLAEAEGRWIETVADSSASGLIAFGAGKTARVVDVRDRAFSRVFPHDHTVSAVALDAGGRRLAVATYGGAALWFARVAEQKPTMLKWAGSHVAVAFSPDAKFLVTAMQENALHAWRLSDGKSLRMGGYPAKPTSLAFLAGGRLMATSGAAGAVVWPFGKSDGPADKQASEIGYEEGARITRVAAAPAGNTIAAGLANGRVWIADTRSTRIVRLRDEGDAEITALALSPDGRRLAWGDEDGEAGLVDTPELT